MGHNLERKIAFEPEETHPPLEIDFESLLAELRDLESQPILGEEEAIGMLLKLYDYYKKNTKEEDDKSYPTPEGALLKIVLGRIIKKCGNGEHIQAFFDHFFSMKFEEAGKKINRSFSAAFSPLTRKIKANAETSFLFNPVVMLGELSAYGFSRAINSVHHEAIHITQSKLLDEWKRFAKAMSIGMSLLFSSQEKKDEYLDKVRRQRLEGRVLQEAHATLGSSKFKASSEGSDYSTGNLYKILSKYEVFGQPLVQDKYEVDRMIAASTEIKRLYALGLGNKEIGELIRKSKWNNDIAGYDTLEEKIAKLLEQQNIEEEDVDNLVLADDIKRKIYVLKAKTVAQEELKKAFAEISKV
ncbi:MAG: hypothetical protein WC858_05685 [Parcubacteria group bacterium]|jgi:hypothetical protein